MTKISRINLVFILIACVFQPSFAESQSPVACMNTYALCSAAKCQPVSGTPNQVLCHCTIRHGKNYGYSSCAERKTHKTNDGHNKLISTFSLGNGQDKKLICPAGSPWANCLDKPCLIVEKSDDPRHAACTCDLVREGQYVTFGGECDIKNCSKATWSGATIEENQNLYELLGKNPRVNFSRTMCPQAQT